VAEWDPQKFTITVGSIMVTQFANGTFIKASFDEDLYSYEPSASGGVGCRIRNANEAGKFEITLLKSSPSNDLLSALSSLDRASGTGVVPVQIKDGNGAAVASAELAWVVKPADLERGKELGDVTWTLQTPQLTLIQGGISPLTAG
jgi:hypothetical protein